MSEAFERALAAFEPAQWPLAVGFSGGADSTALLAACASRWPGQVMAFHVHHGLQAAADDFERHCGAVCERLGVPLVVHRVDARHASGDSPEDAARRARYEAFAAMARTDAPRRSAVSIHCPGASRRRPGRNPLGWRSRVARAPWLVGHACACWAQWPEISTGRSSRCPRPTSAPGSPSATSRGSKTRATATRATPRNRIRAVLLPALEQAFPQFRTTFARSIGHAAQAQQLLVELAAQDLQTVGEPPDIKALQALSRAGKPMSCAIG
jgi:tRNA(Ile)-lysidine synthase